MEFIKKTLLGLFLIGALAGTAKSATLAGYLHNSRDNIPGANSNVKAYLKRSLGSIDTLFKVTNSNGGYTINTANFDPQPNIGDTIYIEAQKDTLGKTYFTKTKWPIRTGTYPDHNFVFELHLDDPFSSSLAFTPNISVIKDTSGISTSFVALAEFYKNLQQPCIGIADTALSAIHRYDLYFNFEKQDSTFTQGDSFNILLTKDRQKAFPDSVWYTQIASAIDTTFWDAMKVNVDNSVHNGAFHGDTLYFPQNVSVKDWSIDSLFTTVAVGDSVEPKAFVKNNRESLFQYNFPDSAKFYLTITGPGVNYSDSLVKRLDSGMEDTLTFKKCYKGDGSCTVTCSTSVFGDATPSNNVKEWITSGPMAVEMGYFGAMPFDKGIKLEWITNSEFNTYQWTVFRGANHDTIRWDEIGTKPGQGTTYQTTNYFYDDTMPKAGVWNYKLKETDMSGEETWYGPVSASVVMAGPRAMNKFIAYPNPVRDLRNIKVNKAGRYSAHNVVGQRIGTIEYHSNGTAVSQFSAPTAAGIYFLTSEETGDTRRLQVVK